MIETHARAIEIKQSHHTNEVIHHGVSALMQAFSLDLAISWGLTIFQWTIHHSFGGSQEYTAGGKNYHVNLNGQFLDTVLYYLTIDDAGSRSGCGKFGYIGIAHIKKSGRKTLN